MRIFRSNLRPLSNRMTAITGLAIIALAVVVFAAHVFNYRAKKSAVANSQNSSTASIVRSNSPTQMSPSLASKADSIRFSGTSSPKQDSGKNPRLPGKGEELQPDTGSTVAGEENGEDPKLRANYFYAQRAYPNDQTPAGARQQSLRQLDAMVALQRAAGILPEEGIADASSVGFPGPANWINLGPQPVTNGSGGSNFGSPAATGRVTAIAVDPTTTTPGSQVVYLGAATGGVWKSTDGGASWNTIFDQNNSLAIGGIAIAPTDHNTIYVGTGELNFSGDSYYGAGIYKSTDGGGTWTQQCGPAGSFCAPVGSFPFQGGGFIVGRIAVNPTNASIALAAVRDAGSAAISGIYRTTDGGSTWTLVPTASGSAGNSIVWNPTDATIVYASLGQTGSNPGVFKSTDGGVTFSKLTGNGAIGNSLPTANLGRHEIAIAPSNPSVLYVAINNISTSSLLGLAKSTDAGATWSFTLPATLPNLPNFCNGQCWYDMALAVLPNDPNTLVVGGSAFTNNSSTDFRSSDGGVSWVDITNPAVNQVRPHVDTHVMTFAATTGGFRLYTGNDGGIWFTDTPTAAVPVTWQAGNNPNLTITQFYPGHAVHPSDENISFGGTQDNGTEKFVPTVGNPLLWDHVTCGDGAWTAIDPQIPSTVYSNCQNIDIRRSYFDGAPGTWIGGLTSGIPTSTERSLFIPPLVQDPNQSGKVYFGTFRVWQSTNFANSWTAISPDITGGGAITSVSVARSNSNTVYATTSDGRVWRTTDAQDAGASVWTNLTKAPLPNRYATMVRADNSNADVAYVSYSGFNGFAGDTAGHIFKTSDGGSTWADISGTAAGALPNTPVNDIAVVHIASLSFDAVFIGTDVGVFECANPTAATPCQTWTPVGTGLPKVPVLGLAYREISATLRAVTHGRGVWVIETPGISAAGLLLLTSITPSSQPAGGGAFTMTFDGNDFGVPSGTPIVLVDGVNVSATSIVVSNSNHMTATIPASVISSAGTHQISISQPGHPATPQNPTNGLTFSATSGAPTLTTISPTQAAAGSAAFSLTATGSNFVCGAAPAASVIQFGGNSLNPTACSSSSLTATVPASLVASQGVASVVVFTPQPGGGPSSTRTFTVVGPPDLTISKSHFGSFALGTTGAVYTISVFNSGGSSTSGTVTVVDTLPAGLAATAITGAGWSCTLGTLTCTRNDVVVAGAGYPNITLTVNVTATSPGNVTNTATVSGGGEAVTTNDTATDVTALIQDFVESGPTAPVTVTAGQTANFTITITPAPGGYNSPITFSASGLPSLSTPSFSPPSFTPGTTVTSTTFSIATTARGGLEPFGNRKPWAPRQWTLWTFAIAVIVVVGLIPLGGKKRRTRLAPVMLVTVVLLAAFTITSCGSSGSAGTPAGTSTITVSATSGSSVHTIDVTLVVQ